VSGPQCPVVTAEDPCPDLPVSGMVVRVSNSDGSAPRETRADTAGRFDLVVARGEYVLQAVVDSAGPTFATPLQVTVSDGGFVEVTLQVDTGIR
jgi:hypothetical protein